MQIFKGTSSASLVKQLSSQEFPSWTAFLRLLIQPKTWMENTTSVLRTLMNLSRIMIVY